MPLYTERHGMRLPIERTSIITIRTYSLLWDICERYFVNLAWKFPELCPDGSVCCGLDKEKFDTALSYEIPNLFRDSYGILSTPRISNNIFETESKEDKFDQFALLDLIEYIAHNYRDITSRNWHSFFKHDDLVFSDKPHVSCAKFCNEINDTFKMVGLLYKINGNSQIERIEDNGVLTESIIANIHNVIEPGLRDLLNEACRYYRDPKPESRSIAVEKLWDAFERLKTYYLAPDVDKKASANRVISEMSSSKSDYIQMFTAEFDALTGIGNNYRIRHHETDKIEISDPRQYDYFFNRCLTLIATAIQYLR
jgi:hypothetical protein